MTTLPHLPPRSGRFSLPVSPRTITAGRIAGLVMLSLGFAPAIVEAQTERRSVGGQRVAVFNLAGDVRVERGSGRDVEVEITRRGPDASRLRIETGDVRGVPSVRVVYPDDDIVYRGGRNGSRWGGRTETRVRDDGTWGGDRGWSGGRRVRVRTSGDGLEAWADIVVRVPDGREVEAYLLVGELAAREVQADLRLDVGAARVTAEGTRGALLIDAGSGGVELRRVSGPRITVDNGSGGIDVQDVRAESCAFDSGSGGVTATTVACDRFAVDIGSGGVRVSEGSFRELDVDAGSGGVRLELQRTPESTRIETGSGGVTLTLPATLAATLDIETGSGRITTDFPVRTNRMERHHLQGTVGDGTARLRVDTGSGSVQLLRGR